MDTRDKVSDYVDDAADYVHGATDYVQKSANKAADVLGQKGEQWLNAEQQFMKFARIYVRNHPVKSLGIAITGAYVLSRLFRDR
jgi:ElaB/YqjD/DUF883 family membrane-anchored ribosome-binding protein